MATIRPRQLIGGHPAPRFLVLAIGSLLSVGLLAPRAFPLLTGSFYDRDLLAFVHLNTLGIIAAAIVASTFQVVPCALGVEPEAGRARAWIFPLHIAGLLVFLLGFRQTWHPVLATGGTLLLAGLGLYIYLVVRALRAAPVLGITGSYIAVAVCGLAVGLTLGFLLAGAKGTWFFGDLTMQVLAAHALMMLGGWVLLMVNGVAYHMVPKISGSDRAPLERLARVELALIGAGVWLAVPSLLFTFGRGWVTLGALLIALGQLLFVGQMARIYAPVARVGITAQMLFVLTAGLSGLGAAGILSVGLLRGEPLVSGYWVAAGWLAIGGIALAAIQGLAPVIGSELTGLPLVHTRRWQRLIALAGWIGWAGSLVLVTWAVLAGDASLTRWGAYLAMLGIMGFAANLIGALVAVKVSRGGFAFAGRLLHS